MIPIINRLFFARGREFMINSVIFDIDGTITDTEYPAMEALRITLEQKAGLYYTHEQLKKYFGIPSADTLVALNVPDPDGSIVKSWSSLFCEMAKEHTKIFDEIVPVLDILKANKITLGVVTSKNKIEFNESFVPLGLCDYFKACVDSEMTEKHKPFADPLNKFFELTGAFKQNALYIGDSIFDYQTARAAGVTFALAGWGCCNPEGIFPDYYFHRPTDLLNLL